MKPTYEQQEALIKFLETHKHLAAGMLRTMDARHKAKQLWTSIALRLNSIPGANKDGANWSKYWTDKKAYLKKTNSIREAAARRAGGEKLTPVTDLEQRMLNILRYKNGFGDVEDAEMKDDSAEEDDLFCFVDSGGSGQVQATKSEPSFEFELSSAPSGTNNSQPILQATMESSAAIKTSSTPPSSRSPSPEPASSAGTPRTKLRRKTANSPPKALRSAKREPVQAPSALDAEQAWLRDIEERRLEIDEQRLRLSQRRLQFERRRSEQEEQRQAQSAKQMAAYLEALKELNGTFERVADGLVALVGKPSDIPDQ